MAEPNDSTPTPPQAVVELVVNLDDTTGEQAAHAIDRLMQRGALDAWATPITMKKGRPAIMLSALVNAADQADFAEQMLRLTGSFGVRFRAWDRVVLDRDWHDRPTRLGSVKLKAGSLHGETITIKPEHESVCALSQQAGVPLPEAHRAAQAAADALLAERRANEAAEGGAG